MNPGLAESVLSRIKPDAVEIRRINGAVKKVIERAVRYASENFPSDIHVEPALVGSVSKNTFLRNPDVDIFVRFPETVPRKDLEKFGIAMGKAILDEPFLKYAEHPYVRGKCDNVAIDLVPCYAISDSSAKMSAVDRTPFHTEFINRNMSEMQRDQVRLLKQFFKGVGVYGAESRIHGFSGYLCELLVLALGDFHSVVEAASAWDYGTVIVPPGASLGDKLRDADSCLIVPDPVDRDRNVAAALEKDSFAISVLASRSFLNKPGLNFFFPPVEHIAGLPKIREELERSGHGILMIRLPRPDIMDDNLYPQLNKAVKNVTALLNSHGFDVNRTLGFADSEIKLLFETVHRQHPSKWVREGPYGWSPSAQKFIAKHKSGGGDIFVIDGRLHSEIEKEFRSPDTLLRKKAKSIGFGADLDKLIPQMEVHSGDEVIRPENREALAKLLFHSFPWEQS
jgi:tRNA nucleotidyltransferase (CCA-adding enzyme)